MNRFIIFLGFLGIVIGACHLIFLKTPYSANVLFSMANESFFFTSAITLFLINKIISLERKIELLEGGNKHGHHTIQPDIKCP
jgi:hypothetical protein